MTYSYYTSSIMSPSPACRILLLLSKKCTVTTTNIIKREGTMISRTQQHPRKSTVTTSKTPKCFMSTIGTANSGGTGSGSGTASTISTSTSSSTRSNSPEKKVMLKSVYDTSENWEDWFSFEEYGSPWERPQKRPEKLVVWIDNDNNQSITSDDDDNNNSKKKKRYNDMILEPLIEFSSNVDDNNNKHSTTTTTTERLENSSRYVIHLLQLLYHTGYLKDMEHIKTQRCYEIIRQLLEPILTGTGTSTSTTSNNEAENENENNQKESNNSSIIIKEHEKGAINYLAMRQRIIRAEAILRTMELFWDRVPDATSMTTTRWTLSNKNQASTITWNEDTTQTQTKNKGKPGIKWPVPTSEIYYMILKSLASVRTPTYKKMKLSIFDDDDDDDNITNETEDIIPYICQNVMLRLYEHYQRKGFRYLEKPSVECWNQVLCAWANTHGNFYHSEKSIHAVQFFINLMEIQQQNQQHLTNSNNIPQPDASSYGHVLRACAHSNENKRACELGSQVAIKFWNGHLKHVIQKSRSQSERRESQRSHSVPITPYMFVFFLRAIGNLNYVLINTDNNKNKKTDNDVSTTTTVQQYNEMKNRYAKEAWEEACRAGVVNEHVLFELEAVSDSLFKELLEPYRKQLRTLRDNNDNTTNDSNGNGNDGDTSSAARPVLQKLQQVGVKSKSDKRYHRLLLETLPEEWKRNV